MNLEEVRERLAVLPTATPDLPGIGGRLKSAPEHFQVEEVLAYRACGSGEHVYVTLSRTGWNTPDVAREIARILGVPVRNVGWAGLKDRNARTTQTFSVHVLQRMSRVEVAGRLRNETPFEVLSVERHRNKLKPGHVFANRFRVLVAGVCVDAESRADAVARRLERTGMPNFFGEQRFGRQMANLDRADALVRSGRRRRQRKDAFFASVFQSAVFNLWLAERMQRGDFRRIIAGDIAKKTDTGGLFTVGEADLEDARQRFSDGAVVYTGPMVGFKTMTPTLEEGRIENELLQRLQVDPESFRALKSPGSRRPGLLVPGTVRFEPAAVPASEGAGAASHDGPAPSEGLRFTFTLPAGCYATMLLREFMKE